MVKKSKSRKLSRKQSRSPVRIKLNKKDQLTGYQLSDFAYMRQGMLGQLIRHNDIPYATVIRRLNALAIFNKNKNPEYVKRIRNDIKYLQKTHYMYSKSYKQRKSPKQKKSRSKKITRKSRSKRSK